MLPYVSNFVAARAAQQLIGCAPPKKSSSPLRFVSRFGPKKNRKKLSCPCYQRQITFCRPAVGCIMLITRLTRSSSNLDHVCNKSPLELVANHGLTSVPTAFALWQPSIWSLTPDSSKLYFMSAWVSALGWGKWDTCSSDCTACLTYQWDFA